MRFQALDLRNYGPFQNAPVLDLSGGQRGLHVIVGPNEAGKSTALRAIRALLFDYPHTTPDNHGRDLGTLRVGATLRNEAGDQIAFLRRKRGVRLYAPDDRAPLPANALDPFLGRLDEATFVDFFSTDHAELVAGGRAIIRGGGRLGEILFSAGTGLAQLDKVRDALQDELGKLFKARNATNPAINKTLVEWKAAKAQVKDAALPTNDWVDAHNQHTRAVAVRLEVSRRKREVQTDLERWRSWLGALRVIPRRQERLDRIDARGDRTVLRSGFAAAYHSDLEASRTAARSAAEARDALASATAELERLGPPDQALLEADAIGRLHADLGRYATARRERPDLAVKLARLDNQVQAIRAALPEGAAIPATGLGSLREPIQLLAREHAALGAKKGEAEAEIARFAALNLGATPLEAVAADTLRWVASLEDAVARASAPGALEAQRLKAQGKLYAAAEQAATALRGLTLWTGTFDDLEALAIPPDATFDRSIAEIRQVDERIKGAEVERIRLETKRLELDREAAQAHAAGAIPTQADLDAQRDRRDALWRSIRRAWVDREPLAPSPARLGDDFEAASRRADALADSLRSESARVAAEAQRAIERRDLTDRIALWTQTLAQAQADRAAAFEGWARHWRPLGIEPLSPVEMRDWVRVDRLERLRSGRVARDARLEVARINDQIESLRDELGHALVRVAEPPAAEGESLAALLARGRLVIERIGGRIQRDAARSRLTQVLTQEAAWLDRWRSAVAPLGLPSDASVGTATAVLDQLGEWLEAVREARATRDLLDDSNAIERRFAAEAAALLGRLEPNSEPAAIGFDWQPIAASLVDRLQHAGEAKACRAGWLARLDEERTKLAKAQADLARATEALGMLASEAGVPGVDDLPAAIQRSGEVEADLADLRRLDEQIDTFAGSLTRAALLEAVAGLDEATLAEQIGAGEEALRELEAQSNRLGEEIGGARARLDAMDTRAGAAEAGQLVETHAARLHTEVEQYARLKLASSVLRDAIERHRKEKQGPVLDRAGALFARLTAGSFQGLQTDLDDKKEPILRGVRAVALGSGDEESTSHPLLDVAEMSEGTADQLYLALRLASLSVHLDDPDHEPAPFVLDDILINFDDGRARAALEALADLSRRTQVLFFTHHDHLAEIARACLPADTLFIHRLIPKGVMGEPSVGAESLEVVAAKPKRKRSAAVGRGEA